LVIAFVILAAFTYTSGLRAPAAIAIVKDILIWITVIVAISMIPIELGGYGKIFAAVPPAKLLLAPPQDDTLGNYSAYATFAFGSALALFLYPHSVTGVLSASNRLAIARNAAFLPAYSLLLALIALLGYQATGLNAQGQRLWTIMVHFTYQDGFEFDYVLQRDVPTSDLGAALGACGRSHSSGSVVRYHCYPVPE